MSTKKKSKKRVGRPQGYLPVQMRDGLTERITLRWSPGQVLDLNAAAIANKRTVNAEVQYRCFPPPKKAGM